MGVRVEQEEEHLRWRWHRSLWNYGAYHGYRSTIFCRIINGGKKAGNDSGGIAILTDAVTLYSVMYNVTLIGINFEICCGTKCDSGYPVPIVGLNVLGKLLYIKWFLNMHQKLPILWGVIYGTEFLISRHIYAWSQYSWRALAAVEEGFLKQIDNVVDHLAG